jgi:hypothetical protein
MMILKVIKDRRLSANSFRERQQRELRKLREEASYRAVLYDEFKVIDDVLENEVVKSIIISIPKNNIGVFLKAIYKEEFSAYNIVQVDENRFEISKKTINF